jgi:thiol-disulfide isomerase/thioredoxin
LIDFYGIWCPPCNLYNETIFNTNEFAEQAKKFVLLKLDADADISWNLKSKFKIGGYPTLLIAKINAAGELEEVERIVGYYPPKEFFPRLSLAYQHRNSTDEQRWKGRFEEWLASQLEQKILMKF